MANRAYLFATDRPDDWDCMERPYYDSRHVIPLSWFLFYTKDDVEIVKCPDYRDPFWASLRPVGVPDADLESWREFRLSANKEIACRRFLQRRPILDDWSSSRLSVPILDRFLERVLTLTGDHLRMDPSEIDYDEDSLPELHRFLERIEVDDRDARESLVHLRSFVGRFSDDPTSCERDVIGWTYPHIPGCFTRKLDG